MSPPRPLRRTLVALVALALVLAGTAALAGAVDEPRSRPETTTPPVTVYVSETLDISDVRRTGGGRLEDDPATFRRVNGTETFSVENPERANFTNVTPGLYDVESDDDDRPELDVVRPHVTSLVLQNRYGENVTGRTVRADRLEVLTVVATYDFDEADRLQVTVRRDGTDVGLDQRAARITGSPGRYTVGMRDRPPGTYTVTVTGSAIAAGTRSATVRVVARDATPTGTPTPMPTGTGTPSATATPTTRVTASPHPTTATETTTAPPATPTPTPTSTQGAGPGPGVIGALAAVALSVAALRRRA
ncbi:MAG: hypothetical protein ABEJ81_04365 [Haloferacaceae archaeon]